MSPQRSRQLLQGLLVAVGVTPIATGIYAVLTGTDGIPGDAAASANIDSELRFFAAFWIAYGVAALRVAAQVERQTLAVRALALVLFAGGIARVVAWIASGRPDALFLVLLALELLIPPLMVSWQSRVARQRQGEAAWAGSS